MDSPFEQAKEWVSQNKWVVALIVAVAFGYSVGKDMALRDNAADQVEAGESA